MKSRRSAAPSRSRQPLPLRLGELTLWVLVLAVPVLFIPDARDPFRLVKLMAGEVLALASLAGLAWRLREVERLTPRLLLAVPAISALGPLLLVATAGLAFTDHPLHVRQGLIDLWIGAACLVGWSTALSTERQRRLLDGLLLPAVTLAPVAILQFHDLWEPLAFTGGEEAGRLGVGAWIGNPADLGAFLVFPCLLLQHALWSRRPPQPPHRPAVALVLYGLATGAWLAGGIQLVSSAPSLLDAGDALGWTVALAAAGLVALAAARRPRLLWGLALVLILYGLAVTLSLTALVALAAGSAALWLGLLPRRRALVALGAAVALLVVATVALPPLRSRVANKAEQLSRGELNRLLTGRLDGWRAAVWMLAEHPLTGVGQGAYGSAYAPAKLALAATGTHFYESQDRPSFGNAHNEYLEAAAEWGVPGLVALGWALWVLWRQARRLRSRAEEEGESPARCGEVALAWAGLVALALLAVTYFPFRVAAVAFPALLWISWVLRMSREVER